MNKIAVLGPEHTYSDEACHLYEKNTNQIYEHVYASNIREVMKLIDQIGMGILPIENTLEGYIGQHIDLLLEFGFSIDSEVILDISFSLISRVDLKDVKVIYVQYATKNQCLKFLNQYKDIDIIITDSNVVSYQMYLNDSNSAAIVPNHLVKDEKVVINDVADLMINHTRFLILKKIDKKFNLYRKDKDIKATLVITPLDDRPGLLYDILKVFSNKNINLISIMSRPTKKEIGTYHFLIELEAKLEQQTYIQKVFDQLKNTYNLEVIGLYQSILKD
ncbi:MAG: ACT domain-containing protein [Acholeplasmataceae bacterium]|nr:ACT domain-containing protein [Acholeplasmataceae bacterium]